MLSLDPDGAPPSCCEHYIVMFWSGEGAAGSDQHRLLLATHTVTRMRRSPTLPHQFLMEVGVAIGMLSVKKPDQGPFLRNFSLPWWLSLG